MGPAALGDHPDQCLLSSTLQQWAPSIPPPKNSIVCTLTACSTLGNAGTRAHTPLDSVTTCQETCSAVYYQPSQQFSPSSSLTQAFTLWQQPRNSWGPSVAVIHNPHNTDLYKWTRQAVISSPPCRDPSMGSSKAWRNHQAYVAQTRVYTVAQALQEGLGGFRGVSGEPSHHALCNSL
jgi:hypothetical protein